MNQRIGGKIFHQYILHKVPKKKIMLSSQNSGKYPDIDKVWTLEENPEKIRKPDVIQDKILEQRQYKNDTIWLKNK